MTKKRVAVLRGGPSSEYDVSMRSGSGVISALRDRGYHVIDIPVTKTGEWLVDGVVRTPDRALSTVDVVFIAMHGEYGEDGTVQRICERLHIPFTGSNAFPSSVAFNKDMTKRALKDAGINLPKHIKVTREHRPQIAEIVDAITATFGELFVVKPLTAGSSIGVSVVPATELAATITAALEHYDSCMVEEYIKGVEATCAVIESFREQPLYVLPPIEIVPPATHQFFSADVKYDGRTTEICPGRFSYEEKERIAALATIVHETLDLSHYSRTDCIVRDGEVYFLEVNTLPGLTSESLFPKAAAAVGLMFPQLVSHLVETATVRPVRIPAL